MTYRRVSLIAKERNSAGAGNSGRFFEMLARLGGRQNFTKALDSLTGARVSESGSVVLRISERWQMGVSNAVGGQPLSQPRLTQARLSADPIQPDVDQRRHVRFAKERRDVVGAPALVAQGHNADGVVGRTPVLAAPSDCRSAPHAACRDLRMTASRQHVRTRPRRPALLTPAFQERQAGSHVGVGTAVRGSGRARGPRTPCR